MHTDAYTPIDINMLTLKVNTTDEYVPQIQKIVALFGKKEQRWVSPQVKRPNTFNVN